MVEWIFQTRRDLALADEVKKTNRALEQLRTEAEVAQREHRKATDRLTRATAESVRLAEKAIKEGN